MTTDEAEVIRREWLAELRSGLNATMEDRGHSIIIRGKQKIADSLKPRIALLEAMNTDGFPEPEPTKAERLDTMRSELHAAEYGVEHPPFPNQLEYYIGERAKLRAVIEHLEAVKTDDLR